MTNPQDPNNPYGQQPPSGEFQQPYGQQPYGQQYPSGGFQQPGYGPMRPKEGPGLATGALICSIAGIFLCFLISVAGIIMGHIAYNKAKRGEAEGQGLAMAAFIVGYAAIGLNILALIYVFGVGTTNGLFG
jgi:hypothetical protein